MDRILEQYGHWVVLVRLDRRINCTCWNPVTREADSKCPLCFGLGHPFRLEKHRARQGSAQQISDRKRGAMLQTPLGTMTSAVEYCYFRHHVQPKERDWVLLVGWVNGQPVDVKEANEVITAIPFRGLGGRLEYTVATIMRKPEHLIRFGTVIRARPVV